MKRDDAGKAGAPRRAQLTRQQVVTAAVELADSGGIESISMRRLAQELGVEAMSLYTHVLSKEDLLDGIADAVIGMIPVDAVAADWRTSLRRMALAARGVMLRHPWAPRVIETRAAPGPPPGVHQRGTRHPSRRRLLGRAGTHRPAPPRQQAARVHPGSVRRFPGRRSGGRAQSSRRVRGRLPLRGRDGARGRPWRCTRAVRRRQRVRVRARLHPRRPRPAPPIAWPALMNGPLASRLGQRTVRVPAIPSWAWPGTGQRYW